MDIPEVNWRTAQLLCGRISKAGAATGAAAGNMGGFLQDPLIFFPPFLFSRLPTNNVHRAVEGWGCGLGCGLMRLFVDDFHLISRNCIKASLNTSLEGILMEKFKVRLLRLGHI